MSTFGTFAWVAASAQHNNQDNHDQRDDQNQQQIVIVQAARCEIAIDFARAARNARDILVAHRTHGAIDLRVIDVRRLQRSLAIDSRKELANLRLVRAPRFGRRRGVFAQLDTQRQTKLNSLPCVVSPSYGPQARPTGLSVDAGQRGTQAA